MKDFARNSGQLDVVFSETGRDRDGKGYGYDNTSRRGSGSNVASFVEFETKTDLMSAVEKLDGQTFKGATVHCTANVRFHPATSPTKFDLC